MIASIISWLIAAPLIAVSGYLMLELTLGLRSIPNRDPNDAGVKAPYAILIPAHDEAFSIAATIEALRRSAPEARIVVVADNCRDQTADLARNAGVEVFVRADPSRIGKGFALAHGRDCLAIDPPEAVIVVDADCRLAPGSAERLVARSLATGRPVQALNLLTAEPNVSPLVAISNFAMLIKNLVRARGLFRVSGGGLLFGTGMAFPWDLFRNLPLATSEAVEDLELGLKLARDGIRVEFDDHALVTSPAASLSDSRGQRSRWEHGFLSNALKQGLPLFIQGSRAKSLHLAMLGLHLMVPPLALFMLLAIAALVVIGGLSLLSGSWNPLLLAGLAFGLVLAMLFLAWLREGRRVVSLAALLRAPLYVAWKIPIYLDYFIRRQTGWNRTNREGERR